MASPLVLRMLKALVGRAGRYRHEWETHTSREWTSGNIHTATRQR